MKKILLSVFAILLLSVQLMAQNQRVTGTVTSASDGSPISGVTVAATRGTLWTTTNAQGQYTISVPEQTTLRFSYVGLTTVEVRVNNQTVINVTMEDEITTLGEVVVMGYGTARKAGTIVGTAAVVKSDVFVARPSTNVMDALQGQVAGLQIMTSSGEPNALSTIRLHGIGSINAEREPLILLDGAPITLGTLMAMNQNDIESMVVLTDASSTSIYGSRGANGVIFVVSKRGQRGEAPTVTLRTMYSFSNASKPRLHGMNTEQYANYLYEIGMVDEADVEFLNSLGNYDWHKAIFQRNAPMFQADLSVNGGSEKASYFFSGGYNDTEGIAPGSEMKRYTFRSAVDTKITNWLKAGMSLGIGYTATGNVLNAANDGLWFTNPAAGAILIPSFQTPYDDNGKPLQILDFTGGYASPLVMYKLFPRRENRLQFNGNLFVEATPIANLTLRSNLAANAFDFRRSTQNSPDYYYNNGVGGAVETFQRNYTWTITNTAEYKWQMNENYFTVLLGQESTLNDSQAFAVGMDGLRDSRFPFLNFGTSLTAGTPTFTISQSTFNSFFGRIEYNYQGKYFADFSMRNDASSRFVKGNQNALFYAIGGMWNIKRESFMENVDAINRLSLKASYGTSGNSGIGDYSKYALLSVIKYNDQAGWAPTTTGNDEIGWEKQKLLTIGLNGQIYSKYRFNIEYYRRDTRDMLLRLPVSGTSGFTGYTKNVGSMRNAGIDVTLNLDLYNTKDWLITFGTTFNYNKNQITSLFNGLTQYPVDETLYMVKGFPYSVYYMQEWRGVDPETGKPQWTDADGGITNDFSEAALVNTKKTWVAPYTGGVNLAVAWKGLTLNADVTWVAGKWMVNNTLYFSENWYFADGTTNQSTGALDYWKNPGDNAKYPSIEEQEKMGGTQFDSGMLENGSFIRLKNLQLSYNLPESILKKQKAVTGVRVWVGTRNLLTWTRFRGLDPEVDAEYGMDDYPNTRQLTFGLEIKF